jgi:hypothetical protein
MCRCKAPDSRRDARAWSGRISIGARGAQARARSVRARPGAGYYYWCVTVAATVTWRTCLGQRGRGVWAGGMRTEFLEWRWKGSGRRRCLYLLVVGTSAARAGWRQVCVVCIELAAHMAFVGYGAECRPCMSIVGRECHSITRCVRYIGRGSVSPADAAQAVLGARRAIQAPPCCSVPSTSLACADAVTAQRARRQAHRTALLLV